MKRSLCTYVILKFLDFLRRVCIWGKSQAFDRIIHTGRFGWMPAVEHIEQLSAVMQRLWYTYV